jgi:hypothetical protein
MLLLYQNQHSDSMKEMKMDKRLHLVTEAVDRKNFTFHLIMTTTSKSSKIWP